MLGKAPVTSSDKGQEDTDRLDAVSPPGKGVTGRKDRVLLTHDFDTAASCSVNTPVSFLWAVGFASSVCCLVLR